MCKSCQTHLSMFTFLLLLLDSASASSLLLCSSSLLLSASPFAACCSSMYSKAEEKKVHILLSNVFLKSTNHRVFNKAGALVEYRSQRNFHKKQQFILKVRRNPYTTVIDKYKWISLRTLTILKCILLVFALFNRFPEFTFFNRFPEYPFLCSPIITETQRKCTGNEVEYLYKLVPGFSLTLCRQHCQQISMNCANTSLQ